MHVQSCKPTPAHVQGKKVYRYIQLPCLSKWFAWNNRADDDATRATVARVEVEACLRWRNCAIYYSGPSFNPWRVPVACDVDCGCCDGIDGRQMFSIMIARGASAWLSRLCGTTSLVVA